MKQLKLSSAQRENYLIALLDLSVASVQFPCGIMINIHSRDYVRLLRRIKNRL